MDFKKHLEKAWKLSLKFIVPLIFMTLVMLIVSACTFGILAPVLMAGYIQSILLMVREGREPKLQDNFSQMRLFLPLLGFGILVLIAVSIGMMLFFLPGILIAMAVSFGCLYMYPLMTDRKMGIVEAIKESVSIVTRKEDVLDHLIVMILFTGISSIGSSVLIGTLVTLPFATIFLMSVYGEVYENSAPPAKM